MAKGKGGKSKGAVSAGIHKNVSNSTKRAVRAAKSEAEKLADKQTAWLKGQNPWITIDNPNKEETNKRRIKVRMNDLMGGSAKERKSRSFTMK